MEIKSIAKLNRHYAGRKYTDKKTGKVHKIIGIACSTMDHNWSPAVLYTNGDGRGEDVAFVKGLEAFESKFRRAN